MKVLSKTDTQGRVVELTQQEFREFAKLAAALEGKSENETHWEFQMHNDGYTMKLDGFDFKGVFGAIEAFYTAKFRANEVRALLKRFESTIENG